MITRAHFASQTSYLSARVQQWTGDLLVLPNELEKPMSDHGIQRYTEMLREHADYIEKLHREKELNL